MDGTGTTIWLTGLPCSGKTTLATALKEELIKKGYKIVHLDGDILRSGVNKDLGFSSKDRKENLRRVACLIRDFRTRGNLVIASFVSPTNELRDMVKKILGSMHLVYVKCSLEECKKRDVKGMYKKAETGEIGEFTGVTAPFEEPDADIVIDTEHNNVQTCTMQILNTLNINKGQ
jgi:adenylyl-sulfate kinase